MQIFLEIQRVVAQRTRGGGVGEPAANSLETVYIISLPNELRPLHVKCVAVECVIWQLHV